MQQLSVAAAKGKMAGVERRIKVGLEIHGYLNMAVTGAKLFCNCAIEPDAEPNTTICPVCTGQPGSKPMLPNKEAIDKIIAIAAMLDCRINERLMFQRKHYDWPDMPTGYQRTMSGSYSVPVGQEGSFLGIGIEEVHLEEDPARWDPETGLVDYNRSGYPLVEIVTKPDFTSAEEVRVWLRRLVTTLSYIKAINPDMGVKADVNVSVAPDFLRVEIKNINSFRSIVRAIEYETARQQREVKEGKNVARETRAWRDAECISVFMRQKETAVDYMFIPDPDLPVVKVTKAAIAAIAKKLPEKPAAKIEKYVKHWKIDHVDAEVLSSEILLAGLFEKVAAVVNPILAARWLRMELLRVLNYNKKELGEVKIDEKRVIQLLKLVESRRITDETAKGILEKLIEKPFDIVEYVRKNSLFAVAEANVLEKYCEEAIAENPQAVADFKSGKEKALNFLVGNVMAKTKGKADPNVVRNLISDNIR
ncbi:Asp-tRNA(Asn)/Glu-tRNA(Gln) amidotransferase subunit GatB [Candidatus Woesearchaeota archaeon]|nr:Asp-tRNA(Asn)/Glu-tRNA(Gln) amidotransferase subunit GatB [Candidatus Woesearchaeota archaeon]